MNVYTIVNRIAQIEAVSYLTFNQAAAEGHGNILRTYRNGSIAGNLSGIREGNIASLNEYSVTLNLAINKVNQTDEVRNHFVGRLGINFVRCADLLYNAGTHNNYAVAHCHCFALIMSYVYNSNAQFFLNSKDFKAHGFTQLSIQVRQRLIQKQQSGLCYQGTRQSYTLLLTAGQLMRITLAVFTKVNQLQHLLYAFFAFLFIYLLNFQRIAYVFGNSHMRPNCIGLEYHADITFFRRSEAALNRRAYAVVADINFTFGSTLKACNHAQGSSFTATGRTEDGNKFAILYN